MNKCVNGIWSDGDPVNGDEVQYISPQGGINQTFYYKPSIDEVERKWRDSELSRTDEFAKLPDYPTDVITYRAELRNYPAQNDFPNGARPSL